MAKKPVQTFHPLQVADSLKEQNDAVGMLISYAANLVSFAPKISDVDRLKLMIAELEPHITKARATMWPQGDD